MSDAEHSRLYNIFNDLQQRQLIDHRRTLELSNNSLVQMQGNKLSKKILYNKKFYNNVLSELDDDTLRFVLLHEEGHIQKGSLLPHLGFLLAIIIFILFFSYPFNYGWPYWLFYILIVIPLVYRSFYITLYKEELIADSFAAEIMKREFHIEKPSKLLKCLFVKADEKNKSESSNEKLKILLISLAIIIGNFPGYHPADCTRIANVRENLEKAS